MNLVEDYCSYELAKLLKEKGFKESIYSYMEEKSPGIIIIKHYSSNWNEEYMHPNCVSCPTHQFACKWLRRARKLLIVIEPEYFEADEVVAYGFSVWRGDNYEHRFEDWSTYEEATEAAIKYCLENLI